MPASAPGFDVFLIAVASIFALVQVVLVTSPLLLIFGWGSKQVKAVTGGNPAARAREVLFSTKFLMRLATCVATVTIVVKMAARVSSDAPFDPYEILAVPASANATELKAAYRALSLAHHPDKAGGSAEAFQRVTQAYASVSDGKGKRNFELYGHPDGPQSVTLGVALPEWMMSDNAAPFLLLAYLAFFAVGGWLCVRWWTVRVAAARKQLSGGPGGLSGQDVASMRQHLAAAVAQGGGRASLFDVVDAVCASPSMLQAGAKALACSPEDITTSPEEVAAALGKLRDVLLSLELSGQGRLPAAAGDGTSQSSLNKLVVLLHLNGKRLKEGALDPDDFPTCLTNGQVKLVHLAAQLTNGFLLDSLRNRKLQETLAALEAMALLSAGLWSHSAQASLDSQTARMRSLKLRTPALGLEARLFVDDDEEDDIDVNQLRAGDVVSLEVVVTRNHRFKEGTGGGAPLIAKGVAEAYWCIAEGQRKTEQGTHLTLVGASPIIVPHHEVKDVGTRDTIKFRAPAKIGKFVLNVHVKSTTFAGVDVSTEVCFAVTDLGEDDVAQE